MTNYRYLLITVVTLAVVVQSSLWADSPDEKNGSADSASDASSQAPGRMVRNLTGESRYGWTWLATKFDADQNGSVSHEESKLPKEMFLRLDRDWDGNLTASDFDWSEKSLLGLQKSTTFALAKVIDSGSDGRINAEEWLAIFVSAAGEHGWINDDQLEELIFRPRVAKAQKEGQSRPGRGQRRASNTRSTVQAPTVDEAAPDFELRSPDGSSSVRLSSYRGDKPVVLIFGSFT